MAIRSITLLILSAAVAMLPRLIRASPHSSQGGTTIFGIEESDLPSHDVLHAIHNAANHAISPASGSPAYVMEHTCTALLRYRSGNFKNQVLSSIELLNRVDLGHGGNYMNIQIVREEWVRPGLYDRTFVDAGSFEASYKINAPKDSNPDYCIVIQEVPDKIDGKLGVASECGYCSTHHNVAYVSEAVDDSLVFAVILHELVHLFCASHSDHGVMRAVVDGGTLVSNASAREVYIGLNNSNWGGPACMTSANISAHSRRCYNDACTIHDDGDHHRGTSALFWLFFFLVFVPFIWIGSIFWTM